MRDRTTFTPLAPGATGSLAPSMSPFWELALPDLDTRAATTTLAWLEIVAPRRHRHAVVQREAVGKRRDRGTRNRERHARATDGPGEHEHRIARREFTFQRGIQTDNPLQGGTRNRNRSRNRCRSDSAQLPRFGNAAGHRAGEFGFRWRDLEEPFPVADRSGVIAALEFGAARERERLDVLRVDCQRALDDREWFAFETAAARHGERVGVIGEQPGVLRR